MKMLLKAHELWEVIEDDEDEEDVGASAIEKGNVSRTKSDAKWRKKDRLALSNIALALQPSE